MDQNCDFNYDKKKKKKKITDAIINENYIKYEKILNYIIKIDKTILLYINYTMN